MVKLIKSETTESETLYIGNSRMEVIFTYLLAVIIQELVKKIHVSIDIWFYILSNRISIAFVTGCNRTKKKIIRNI